MSAYTGFTPHLALPSSLTTRCRNRGEKQSFETPEGRVKHIEYVLLTALMGAMSLGLGTTAWPALSNLAAIFTQIAQALQVTP